MENDDNRSEEADGIHGFYRSPEGREFLRFAFGRFLKLSRRKVRKVATSVADPKRANELEEGRTRQALLRWQKGQAEIWVNDPANTRRVLRRLEIEMMLEPEIAQICHARANVLRCRETANGLANLFFGLVGSSSSVKHAEIVKYKGVFEILDVSEFRILVDKPERIFWNLVSHEKHPFLLFQEFYLPWRRRPLKKPKFERLRAGFVLPAAEKTLILFVVSHLNPALRWIEILHSKPYLRQFDPDYSWESGDLWLWIEYVKISELTPQVMPKRDEMFGYLNDTSGIILRRPEPTLCKYIDDYFRDLMWDIPL